MNNFTLRIDIVHLCSQHPNVRIYRKTLIATALMMKSLMSLLAPQSLARVRCVESSGKLIDLQPHQVAVTEVYALMIISEVLRSCPGTVVDKCY